MMILLDRRRELDQPNAVACSRRTGPGRSATARRAQWARPSTSIIMLADQNTAVNKKTMIPAKKPNRVHTIGASRNGFHRGVNMINPNWTTRNSSKYTTPMNVTMPMPVAASTSTARHRHREPDGISGTDNPSAIAPTR